MKNVENNKPHSIFTDFIHSTLGVTSLLALMIIGFAIWMQIQATLHYESGMEYGFIVFYPLVLVASFALFINGILLLIRATRRHHLKEAYRITLTVLGLTFLFPAGYLVQGLISSSFVTSNATRISSNEDVLRLVRECKVQSIRREFTSWAKPLSQDNMAAKVFLRDSAKSQAEKNSYFYGYRSFNPRYYEELIEAAESNMQKCGNIDLYDEWRESWPTTYTWLTPEKAKATLDACQIRDVVTSAKAPESLTKLASNPESAKTGIFRVLDPISEGYSGTLYIAGTDKSTHDSLLEFSRSKKGHCRYKQPNIDGVE